MIEPTFMAAWNWDARPFPAFPMLGVWGDAPNWRTGTWIGGKGPALPVAMPDAAPIGGPYPAFPTPAGQGWSVTYAPKFPTALAAHVSGRESRAGRAAMPRWTIELVYDVLSDTVSRDIEAIVDFYDQREGGALPFVVSTPPELNVGATIVCRFAEDQLDLDEFSARLIAVRSLTLLSIR